MKLLISPFGTLLTSYHGRRRDALLPLLHEAQALYGWLPREVQEAVSKTLRVPLADIHGVIEFYTMFYNQPMARTVVRVCEDVACQLAGCEAIHSAIAQKLGLQPGQVSADGAIAYERVPCLGMCEHAPNALYGEKPAGDFDGDGRRRFPRWHSPRTTAQSVWRTAPDPLPCRQNRPAQPG
ncbi:MAG: NAD(P)H-dependent oxidoreductase subunit E [Anaerolineae bacterium]|nr:NAD(P)H-dependent oxidoreductase subunit E [Anaerolineae bacterium]